MVEDAVALIDANHLKVDILRSGDQEKTAAQTRIDVTNVTPIGLLKFSLERNFSMTGGDDLA